MTTAALGNNDNTKAHAEHIETDQCSYKTGFEQGPPQDVDVAWRLLLFAGMRQAQ